MWFRGRVLKKTQWSKNVDFLKHISVSVFKRSKVCFFWNTSVPNVNRSHSKQLNKYSQHWLSLLIIILLVSSMVGFQICFVLLCSAHYRNVILKIVKSRELNYPTQFISGLLFTSCKRSIAPNIMFQGHRYGLIWEKFLVWDPETLYTVKTKW